MMLWPKASSRGAALIGAYPELEFQVLDTCGATQRDVVTTTG